MANAHSGRVGRTLGHLHVGRLDARVERGVALATCSRGARHGKASTRPDTLNVYVRTCVVCLLCLVSSCVMISFLVFFFFWYFFLGFLAKFGWFLTLED